MRYSGIDDFLAKDGLTRAKGVIKGPIAVIMAEDTVELDTTLRHHLAMGFGQMVLLAPDGLLLRSDLEDKVHRLDFDLSADDPIIATINRLIEAAPGVWFYYCFNAEYLFFPFCETRSINDLLAFHTEERRDAMLTYVIDLYAADLSKHPGAVSLDTALLDKSGYYALARPDPANGHPRERQLDFFGGLRWRFEEHVPENKRKIDRISIFRAKPGLKLRPDFTFNDQEYNTYACPWHNNLTAAVCSFRTAKALKANPGSKYGIDTFRWHNSTEFHWTSQQLLDLGLMEPGQWF
jgi:hypothetical protein